MIAAKQTVTTFHNKRPKREDAKTMFYLKKTLIYSADKTFQIIRIINLNRAEPTCYRTTDFHYASFGRTKWSFFVHSTTHIAPYLHLRLDSILELCCTFQNECLPKKSILMPLPFFNGGAYNVTGIIHPSPYIDIYIFEAII